LFLGKQCSEKISRICLRIKGPDQHGGRAATRVDHGALSINIPVHINDQCIPKMSSIIWYIYNESLKKERELLEKARKKAQERLDRIRNIPDSGTPPDNKKTG
jgi:hypothetical protein